MPPRSPGTTRPTAARLLADARDPLFVAPPVPLAREVALSLRTGDARARFLLRADEAATLFDEFRAATAAAQAVADGRLAVRTAEELTESLTLDVGRVWVNVRTADQLRSLSTSDDAVTTGFREAFERRWNGARPYRLDVPPRDELLDSFGDRWPDAVDTLARALEGADAVRGDDALDPVGLCTLVGARHRLFSIELGEWAREVGFSSRTEVARAKERLTAAGVVETRRVPNGVGRPRQQLALADGDEDEDLASLPPADLVATARERLSLAGSAE